MTWSLVHTGAVLLAGLTLSGASSVAFAQSKTEADILEALKPRGVTRSLSLGAPESASNEDAAFVETLKGRSRSLSMGGRDTLSAGERDKLAAISATKPSIDLEIPFDLNSARIGRQALPAVRNLGAALGRPELRGGTFIIAGHTDAKGSDQANQALSERRAAAVKQYLVQTYRIPAENLVSVGFGESKLKNKADPMSGENRRVQATNLTETKSAAR